MTHTNKMAFFVGLCSIPAGTLAIIWIEGIILATSLIILGAGYTARYLIPVAQQRYPHIIFTSRDPDRHLSHIQPEQRRRFDLATPNTWANIPADADLLWCFPATPTDLVQQFAEQIRLSERRLVVLGSTSAYEVGESSEYPPPWIDETAPVDLTIPRVEGEEFLRTTCGAIVLRVAGIYGPSRNPIDWIRSGRVGRTRKYVNLIHVDDLVTVCLAALRNGTSGEVYNVSDGQPKTWIEICDEAARRWKIPSTSFEESPVVGKRLSCEQMQKLLTSDGAGLRHPDLFEALALLL